MQESIAMNITTKMVDLLEDFMAVVSPTDDP